VLVHDAHRHGRNRRADLDERLIVGRGVEREASL
jgi:hypothetical protein